jgi:hypothetical protein
MYVVGDQPTLRRGDERRDRRRRRREHDERVCTCGHEREDLLREAVCVTS